jgi:Uma2 family endonuclease
MSTVKIRIGPADNGRRMTLEEFREAEEEEGYRYELARGVLEVTQVPNDPHGQIVDNLHHAVTTYRDQHPGLIRRVGGAGEFRLWVDAMSSGRNPDLAIVFEGTPKDDRGRRRPSWVAEVVSKRGEDRDYVKTREEYLTFGIQEYWIIDPQLGRVTVLIRRDGPGEPAWSERVFTDDEVIAGALLPGFQGTVSELWINAELDGDEVSDELEE